MLQEAVQNMVSGYQRQNLDMAVSAEISKKATSVAGEAVLKVLDSASVNVEEVAKAAAVATGRGTNLNVSA